MHSDNNNSSNEKDDLLKQAEELLDKAMTSIDGDIANYDRGREPCDVSEKVYKRYVKPAKAKILTGTALDIDKQLVIAAEKYYGLQDKFEDDFWGALEKAKIEISFKNDIIHYKTAFVEAIEQYTAAQNKKNELTAAQHATNKFNELKVFKDRFSEEIQLGIENVISQWNADRLTALKRLSAALQNDDTVKNAIYIRKCEQWIEDIKRLAKLCSYEVEKIKPTQTGNERNEELVELYLFRDNADIKELLKEFPTFKSQIEILTGRYENGVRAIAHKIPIAIDNEMRVYDQGRFWGIFCKFTEEELKTHWEKLYLPITANSKDKIAQIGGEVIPDFSLFLRERFKEILEIKVEIEGVGEVFEKITKAGYRPVKRSDIWYAYQWLLNAQKVAVAMQDEEVERRCRPIEPENRFSNGWELKYRGRKWFSWEKGGKRQEVTENDFDWLFGQIQVRKAEGKTTEDDITIARHYLEDYPVGNFAKCAKDILITEAQIPRKKVIKLNAPADIPDDFCVITLINFNILYGWKDQNSSAQQRITDDYIRQQFNNSKHEIHGNVYRFEKKKYQGYVAIKETFYQKLYCHLNERKQNNILVGPIKNGNITIKNEEHFRYFYSDYKTLQNSRPAKFTKKEFINLFP